MPQKKIAILTQPLGSNYGGIIQNYALQKVLNDNGYIPETINRTAGKVASNFLSFKIELAYKFKNIEGIPLDSVYTKRKVLQHTFSFMKKYIKMTKVLDTNAKLEEYFKNNMYDVYIVGSDQTWRPKYSPNIYTYYLDFLKDNKAKRVAYASSFGTDEWEYTPEQQQVCIALAQQFDAISVREDSGIDLCNNYLNAKAYLVVDPTLLLSAEDYSIIINSPKVNKGLFTYVLDKASSKEHFIKKCSEKLQLSVTNNQAKYSLYSNESKKIVDYILPPLEGWLQGFRDAEFVITDSFHGMVFSIINQKPFFALVNKERGASRFTSLLGQLGLLDRLIYDVNEFDYNLLQQEIDYTKVYEKLNPLKQKSLNYLLNSLKD